MAVLDRIRAFFSSRATEASPEQVAATGAAVGWGHRDPLDGDTGWRPAGSMNREVPYWTQEKARIYSIAAYRANPMARAIVDTYTSFCVGDSGVTFQCTNPEVQVVVDAFWNDPRNRLGSLQELFLRDQMLSGETLLEMLVGKASGVVRFSPIDPVWIQEVTLKDGNPLWLNEVYFAPSGATSDQRHLSVVAVDDATGLRTGQAMFWTPSKALLTDRRGMPFLSPILDDLDSYDTIISNLIDRTALARYLVWDVTVNGTQTDVDAFIAARGGQHVPQSGSVEVHNESVKWEPKVASTGAYEDSAAARSVLTSIAGGAGLAKHWLSEPEDANRATSQTMAEPVRRRVGGVQKTWLEYQTELVRFAVDRAVAARRLPATVAATDPTTGRSYDIPASQCVTVTGPKVAAADAQITAQVLLNLSTGLEKLVTAEVMSPEAAKIAARKAWEQFVGVPYTADLDKSTANPDNVAQVVDDANKVRPLWSA